MFKTTNQIKYDYIPTGEFGLGCGQAGHELGVFSFRWEAKGQDPHIKRGSVPYACFNREIWNTNP